MARKSKTREFIAYCLGNKTYQELAHEFYHVTSANNKEYQQFELLDYEWRYCIRKALEKKRKIRDAQEKESNGQ
jgi:hypothetical protein